MIERAMLGRDLTNDELVWNCLTCKLCQNYCPEDVDFIGFIKDVRQVARDNGGKPEYTHGELMQTMARIIASGKFRQDKLGWLDRSKLSTDGDVALFIGCGPYVDTVLKEEGSKQIQIANSAIEILNKLGIKPRILENEVCCGHDMLWIGENETFEELSKKNLEAISESGISKLIFTCPEGYSVIKNHYPEMDVEFAHISEVVSEFVDDGKITFNPVNKKVTYQDPCRLGRFLGIYDQPRIVLEQIPGIELVEMERSRSRSRCCGVSAWINCNQNSKKMQLERLDDAVLAAPNLITNCPKCLTHFTCVKNENGFDKDIELVDWTVLVSQSLRGV
jgi:Fe-S oxidoreductase